MVKRVLIVLLCLVVVAALAGVIVGLVSPSLRVYSVDEVQAGLRQQPRAWVGRTVLIRGWSNSFSGQGCPLWRPVSRSSPSLFTSCKKTWLLLTPTFPSSSPAAFPVLLPRTGPDLTLTTRDPSLIAGIGLHMLPVIGPTLFHWSGSRTLRVKLTIDAPSCESMSPCGVLVP